MKNENQNVQMESVEFNVFLTQGKYTTISVDTWEKVSKHKWYAQKIKGGFYYASTRIGKRHISLHRFLMNLENPKEFVDHKDGNTLNNTLPNLRVTNNSGNQRNIHKPVRGSSGVRGVHWHKSNNKWISNIRINGKLIHLGYFINFEDAVETRRTYEKSI